MARTSDIPLHVYQVLEEEYLSLHGPFVPDLLTVRLPKGGRLDPAACRPTAQGEAASPPDAACEWREIEAARDWMLRRGHLRDPALLAADLLPRNCDQFKDIPHDLAKMLPAYEWSKEKLKGYIYGKIDIKLLKELMSLHAVGDEADVPEPLVARLTAELNKLLADKDLFHPDRFRSAWLSPAGRGLIDLHKSLPDGQFRTVEDLTHFNRVLLEDAFPEIEKIFDIRFGAICQRLHEARQSALSLSGGGIRSGTFALGLLQGMARHNLLKEFDYLSTVSGGGYIGGWLTAWLHRHPEGLEGVTRDLANSPPARKVDPEPAPLRHLRMFSNFITPKVGLLTADTWTFGGIYFRNLLLNWLVFIPLLLALLLLPRLLLAVTLMQPVDYYWPLDGIVDRVNDFTFWYGRYVLLILGFLLGVWALAYIDFNRPGLREQLRQHSRFWRERSDQRNFLKWCLVPLVASAALLTTYAAWSSEYNEAAKDWWVLLAFGVAFIVGAALISSIVLSRHRQIEGEEHTAHAPRQWKSKLVIVLCLAVAGLFAGLLFWALSRGSWGIPVITYKPLPPTTDQYFDYTTWSGVTSWTTELYVCFAVPLFLLVFWGATTFFVGVSSVSANVSDDDREWWARLGAWLLIAALAWAVGTALVIYGPIALIDSPRLLTAAGGLSGLGALLLGRSSKTAGGKDEEAKAKGASAVIGKLLPLLALIFVAAFLAALSLGTTYLIKGLAQVARDPLPGVTSRKREQYVLSAKEVEQRKAPVEWLTNANSFDEYTRYISPTPTPTPTPAPSPATTPAPADKYAALTRAKLVHMNVLHHTSLWFTLGLTVALAAFGLVLSRFINLNIFSLHGGYRNRLIRAFLGASRPAGERHPNPFTGFDPADNLPMHELRPGLFDEDDFPKPAKLAAALTNSAHPLSAYLAQSGLTQTVADSQSQLGAGGGDIVALRTDLNRVLVEENLYERFAPQYLQTARARDIQRRLLAAHPGAGLKRDLLRTDYQVLLNRLVLEEAYPGLFKRAPYPPPPYKLLHVVSTTLNLVGGDNLAWQQRKAEPFSVSPLHSGCFRLGYRESRNYGGDKSGGISIGTAAAISGAAASSNMGYYTTSPVISLLLTLFNVRLGWWLGNPGPHGNETYKRTAPRSSVMPVISEALGMTDDRNPYVYLTDGGHFENLALYEMVLRRCRVIVCSDGAQDADYHFSDLGNAVRKIRIDLGVPIEFTRVPIYAKAPPREDGRGLYFAVGKIRYSCVDWGAPDGVLIYIKPAVYGTEPRDVLEYKESFPSFPHQSTGDQFFDEPQFESYRMLGSHIMDAICGEDVRDLDIRQLIDRASDLLTGTSEGFPSTDLKLKDWLADWLKEYDAPATPP